LHISFGIATTILIQLGTTKNNVKKNIYQITNFFGQNIIYFFAFAWKTFKHPSDTQTYSTRKKRKLQALTKLFVLLLKTFQPTTWLLISYSLLQLLPILQADWGSPTHG
jgi:hypothetical protein